MRLSPGKNAPKYINIIIEIPSGSNIKYEQDEESGLLKVDRVLYTSMMFPFNYGHIPGTRALDGDPLDVLLISSYPLYPGSIIEGRTIGVLYMEDEKGKDEKIVAVPAEKIDPTYSSINDIKEVTGWGGVEEAQKMIKEAIQRVTS